MTTRITLVLEYPSDSDVPRIGPGTRDFGAFTAVTAVQFTDALAELEVLLEGADDAAKERAWQAAVRTRRALGKSDA